MPVTRRKHWPHSICSTWSRLVNWRPVEKVYTLSGEVEGEEGNASKGYGSDYIPGSKHQHVGDSKQGYETGDGCAKVGAMYGLSVSTACAQPSWKAGLGFPLKAQCDLCAWVFWHQHHHELCPKVRKPKSNSDYWVPKLERNVQRDRENQARLEMDGWKVLVVWECEVDGLDEVEGRIRSFLDA